MTEKQKRKLPEWLTATAALIYYWVMALYKLTEAPIWQDEAMEYYCSLPVKGAIRGITEYATMYERMAYIQQQPPLYNWLMCVWLQIYDSEWWYRFSSVIMGFGAVLILYQFVRKRVGKYTAAFSVIIFSSIYIVMYYVKEAAEYILLIMFLFGMIYYFFEIVEKVTLKKIIGFATCCCLSMLTHYCAVFTVVSMALVLLFYFFRERNWRAFWQSFFSYVISAVGIGLPLLIFFVRPQSDNSVSTLTIVGENGIELLDGNLLKDFCYHAMAVLRWCMLDFDRDGQRLTWLIWIVVFLAVVVGIFVWIKTKKKTIRYFIGCNILIYLLYYVATILKVYAYGWFGNRYNLFFIPLFLVLAVMLICEFLEILGQSQNVWIKRMKNVLVGIIVLGLCLYCMYGDYRVHNHWDKSDNREVVRAWYEEDTENIPTFVHFHERYSYVYYLTHNEKYDEHVWDNIFVSMNVDAVHYTLEQWVTYLQEEIYPDGVPEKLYVVAGKENSMIRALKQMGYKVEPIVDTTAMLFLCEKE